MSRSPVVPTALAFGLLISCLSAAATGQTAVPLSLDETFAQAMVRSEVVATQSELIRQAEERYQQALFRGFREFAAIRQSQALVGAQGDDYQNARVQLFKDVAQNFYDVLTLEQDLKNIDEQIGQYQQREKELQDRVRIGRTRPGEVLTVQATISTLRAQVEQARTQLSTARDIFAFLSGLPATTPLRDTEAIPADPGALDSYLSRVALRPDVKAAQRRQTAAQENISVARGAHLPSLDLNANRYLERTGSLENVDWDVQLALTVPIYSGGSVQSRVREAQSQKDQAELATTRARRLADQEIRSFYQTVVLDRSRLDALEKATDAAKSNYETQRRDYRLGLVTNLDVLQALSTYLENQQALDRVRYNVKLNYLRLQAAAVRRPAMPEETKP
ncbi:MAG: outer rane efflux protein [Proteobacteria bacterium]|nr:outer rane efflux protein [Pseudomonadota bacterium]